jgi:hypothetical protein
MMRLRPIPVLAVALGLAAPLSVHASAAAQGPCEEGSPSQAEPFVACGRTTVVGPRGSTLRLHVPHETVLDLSTQGSPATFRNTLLKGDGPVQGFLLTDNALPSDGGRYVYAVHLLRGFYSSVQDYAEGNFEQRGEGSFVIPPGDYSFYVISDGNPVTATLPFEGQPGTATYEPSRVTLLDFRVLQNRLPGQLGSAQGNIWTAGHAGTFRRPGFHAMTWAAVTELPDPGAVAGWCYYFGRPQNEDTAYLPGCPNAFTEEINTASVVEPGFHPDAPSQGFASAFSGAGGRAIGWWRVGTKPLERIGALSYWFEFDPAFTP